MNLLIWIYFIGYLLITVWLIYVMRTKLDEFDWQYHRSEIWFNCILTLLFWPFLLILKPIMIFDENQLFNFDIVFGSLRIQGIGQRMRNLKQLSDSPPPCGSTICYHHADSGVGIGKMARLLFKADDIVTLYKGKTLPLYSSYEKTAFVSWVRGKDKSINTPTEVPVQINFQDIAVSLLDAGYGLIECDVCASRYRACELNSQKQPIHHGWNYITYSCPKGHELLQYNYAHFLM